MHISQYFLPETLAGRRYDENEGVNVMVEVHAHDKSKMGTPNWTHREEGVRK